MTLKGGLNDEDLEALLEDQGSADLFNQVAEDSDDNWFEYLKDRE